MARTNVYIHRIPLTAEQVFASCTALNQAATQLQEKMKVRRVNRATRQAWMAEANKLRELSGHFLQHWKKGR